MKRKILIGIIATAILLIGNNLVMYRQTLQYRILSCALDGALAYCMKSECLAGIVTPMTILFVLLTQKPGFTVGEIVRYKSRKNIYLQHLKNAFAITFLMLVLSMVFSFMEMWILSGELCNWESEDSIYYVAMKSAGLDKCMPKQLVWQFIKAFLINFMEVYAVVIIAILIYWLCGMSIAAFGITLVYCIIAAFINSGFKVWWVRLIFNKVTIYSSYIELFSPGEYINSIFRMSVVIYFIYLLSTVVVNKKEFL